MTKSAFFDFRPDEYPITMRAFRVDTGEEVWSEIIDSPPVIVQVPALATQLGVKVWMEVEFATGRKEVSYPDDE